MFGSSVTVTFESDEKLSDRASTNLFQHLELFVVVEAKMWLMEFPGPTLSSF